MKSAFELAMERLEKESPTHALTDEQKSAIAEIDSSWGAKIAEKHVFLEGEIRKAVESGNLGDVDALRKQLASETARLEERREEEKAKVRAGR